jgi:hypothetical protein
MLPSYHPPSQHERSRQSFHFFAFRRGSQMSMHMAPWGLTPQIPEDADGNNAHRDGSFVSTGITTLTTPDRMQTRKKRRFSDTFL